jgi:hypothetical protein
MDLINDKDFQQDMMKFATMLSFSKSFSSTDKEWQMASIYILIGFASYHAVTKKILKNELEGQSKAIVKTWMKVGTMLAVSRSLTGKPFDKEFIMDSVFTLLGFNAFDVLTHKFVPEIEHPILANIVTDVFVVSTMSVVKQILLGKPTNKSFITSTLQTIGGFAVYDIISGLN